MASDEEEQAPAAPLAAVPPQYRIRAPWPVSGGVYGVGFANGHAIITDPVGLASALEWFRAEPGYSVEAVEEQPADEPPPAAEAPEPAAAEPEAAEAVPEPPSAPDDDAVSTTVEARSASKKGAR